MKIFVYTFITVLYVAALTSAHFAQDKPTADEVRYWKLVGDAQSKSEKVKRKETSIGKTYRDDTVVINSTGVFEYLPPNRSRWTSESIWNGKITKIEQITIGDVYYRKENDGQWVKRRKDGEGFGLGGREVATREYIFGVETVNGEKMQVLTERKTNYNGTFLEERKVFITKNGLIAKKLSSSFRLDPNTLVGTHEEIYDYSAKPTPIVAPIK